MYKAKIKSVDPGTTFSLEIPCLGLTVSNAHAIGPKDSYPLYRDGDLVIVSETNDHNWIILGYVYAD